MVRYTLRQTTILAIAIALMAGFAVLVAAVIVFIVLVVPDGWL